MSRKQIGLAVVLADFSALTAYAVYEVGYFGFFESLFGSIVSITLFADLVIALSLAIAWMWRDARERGVSAAPYIVATFLFGSVGPLVYLIRREHIGVPANARLHVADA